MIESKDSVSGNDPGEIAPTPVDCGYKKTAEDSKLVEMEMNPKQGTDIANFVLSRGFVLKQLGGSFKLFGPNSDDPLMEFSTEQDFKDVFNALDMIDLVLMYPMYKDVLLDVMGCGVERVIEATESGGVLEEPIERTGRQGGTEGGGPLPLEGGQMTSLQEPTVMIKALSDLFNKGAVLVVPKGSGKTQGKGSTKLNSLEEVVAWGSANARGSALPNNVQEKGKRKLDSDSRQKKKGKRKKSASQVAKEGERNDIPVTISNPVIRCSNAIIKMVSIWLTDQADLSLNIERSKQSIRQSQIFINNRLNSIRNQNDSIEKHKKSVNHFRDIVAEALRPLNAARGVIVSTLSEYNRVKVGLETNVTIYCHHKSSHKGKIRDVVEADGRTFLSFRD